MLNDEEVHFDTNTPLGGVRTSKVYKGSWRNNLVAVKVLAAEASLEVLSPRIDVWRELNHPNVLEVFGMSPQDSESLFVVSRCMLNGNVRQYLSRNPNANRAGLALDVATGMQYLHERGIIHGSLKPSNVLINEDGIACVGDYGMVEVQTSKSTDAHRFWSPEAWKGTLSKSSDVYAFAMTAYEIFTSTMPWGILSEKHIYQLVVYEGTRPDRPDPEQSGLTDARWSLLDRCWSRDSSARLKFDDIVNSWNEDSVNAISGGMSNMRFHTRSNSHGSMDSGPPAYTPEAIPVVMTAPAPVPVGPSQSGSFTPPQLDVVRPLAINRGARTPPNIQRSPQSSSSQLPAVAPVPQPHYMVVTPPSATDNSNPDLPVGPGFQTLTYQRSRTPPSHRATPTSSPSSYNTSFNSGPSNSIRASTSTNRSTSMRSSFSSVSSQGQGAVQKPFSPMLSQFPENELEEAASEVAELNNSTSSQMLGRRGISVRRRDSLAVQGSRQYGGGGSVWDGQSVMYGGSSQGTPSINSQTNPVLLTQALQAAAKDGQYQQVDVYLIRLQNLAAQSDKDAERLVTAGAVPTLIHLLKLRAGSSTGEGLESILIALGMLAHDSISANTIYRTNTVGLLLEIYNSTHSPTVAGLTIWCLNRICRSTEIANGLLRANLPRLLTNTKGLRGTALVSKCAAWCLGAMIVTDAIADQLADQHLVFDIVDHLRKVTKLCMEAAENPTRYVNPEDGGADAGPEEPESDDICAALFAIGRMSRSIKLAKALHKAGVTSYLAYHLNTSEDPAVLDWAARAVGCLMRPNSGDMARALLEAGVAKGLARLPSILPPEEVQPLASFAFAISRFSCAEWGSGTRKALVDAGVVDSLLAALRTAADEPYPQVHIELALAVSFLGDVGGKDIRKEIINAGGIDILKRVGANGNTEVSKACGMAVTSITGNLWTRNAASAKTAMTHNWSGGCPDFQPPCPMVIMDEEL